jgi:hypothetical protein
MNKKIVIAFIFLLTISGAVAYFLSNNPIEFKEAPDNKFSDINITDVAKDKEILGQVLKKIGIKETMAKLIQESGGGSQYDCHQEAHNIGRIGYKIEKENAFRSCSFHCHSGCYHGAMESLLFEKGTANLAKDITDVCSNFETSFGSFECLHGVGHGILAYLDYDMPQAIADCKKLPDSFSQSSCYGGMFMENILTGQGLGASEKDHSTSWVNNTDPYYPCNKVSQEYEIQYQCYQMQTSWMLTLTGYNFDIVSKQCQKAPNNMQSVCFKSLGRDAAGYTLRNPQKTVDICAKAPAENDYYRQCISGAVNVIIDFWGPELKNQANQLCALTPEPHRENCYKIIANRMPEIFKNKEEWKKICDDFEPNYKSLCQ